VTHESLRRAWADDGTALGGWVAGGGEFSLELYRQAGYDYVGIDCQHSVIGEETAAAILRRTPAGSPATIVRVSKNDGALIGRVADAGADGVIVPMVNTAAETAAALDAVRYPPHGVRSFGPVRPDLGLVSLAELSDRVSVFVMIETTQGLANIDDICAVPGIAGVYIGPADLSIGLGLNPLTAFSSDQLAEPIERIRKACAAAGIVLGMHQRDAETAALWIGRGVRLATIGNDAATFLGAVTGGLAALRPAEPGTH
jgi:4-hydroxy-2-oxoheptanedioate aldolase